MDNLPPRLSDRQLKSGIDQLIAGGVPKEQVQAFVNNYQRDSMGSFVLKGQTTTQPTPVSTGPVDQVTANKQGESIGTSLERSVAGRAVKGIANALTRSEQKFGQSIAAGFAGNNLPDAIDKGAGDALQNLSDSTRSLVDSQLRVLKAIQQAKAEGKDYSNLVRTYNASAEQLNQAPDAHDIIPSIDKSAKQVFGEALGVATDIAGAGSLPGVAKAVTAPITFLKGAKAGAKAGAILGAGYGAAQGVAGGLQENLSGSEVLKKGATEGLIGGVAGGLFGALTGGISGAVKGRNLKKAEATSEISKLKGTIFSDENINVAKRELSEQPHLATLQKYIDGGELTPDKVFKKGNILQDNIAQDALNDAANKLDLRFEDAGLGNRLRRSIDITNASQDDITKEALKLVNDFSDETKTTLKAIKNVTPNPEEINAKEYKQLLRQGKIKPKTGKQPASYIMSEPEKKVAYKYRDLLQDADPVKNLTDVREEIVRQSEDVGTYLKKLNRSFDVDEFKTALKAGMSDLSDVTIPNDRIEGLKDQLVNNFVDSLDDYNLHSAWEGRINYDTNIKSAFSGSPTLQKQAKLALRKSIQDFIANKTEDTFYKTAMKEMSTLFDIEGILQNKAVKEKGKNALMLWIKRNPIKAKVIGATGATLGIGAVGSAVVGD